MGYEEWRRWQQSPWGRIRYATSSANVEKNLPDSTEVMRVLDLGGGDGSDSVPLAAKGHRVTLVDSDPAMLQRASERAQRERVDLRIVDADLASDWPRKTGAGYNVVLLHNVIQYLDEPVSLLREAVSVCADRSTLSVIAINKHSAAIHEAVRRSDLDRALEMLDADFMHAVTFDTHVRLFTAEEVIDDLRALGVENVAHYGIRTISDFITDDDRKHEPDYFDRLMRLELATTDRWPYMHTARLFQLVARVG